MARKHTYHKENCDCLIREIIVEMNINSIFKRKHKYLVTFYKPSRVRKYICTRTIGSALQFALKKSFKYGVFTIKRLDK